MRQVVDTVLEPETNEAEDQDELQRLAEGRRVEVDRHTPAKKVSEVMFVQSVSQQQEDVSSDR